MHRREVWPDRSSGATHGARLHLLAQKKQPLLRPGRPGSPWFCFQPLSSAREPAHNVQRVPTRLASRAVFTVANNVSEGGTRFVM